MPRSKLTYVPLLVLATAVLTGCIPKMTMEQMKEMRPQRPVELDRLNMFAGSWESSSEATMAMLDEVMTSTGSSEAAWECDGWCLVERATLELEGLGKMVMTSIWSWDAKSKKYRSMWAGNDGGTAVGTASYCEETKTWRIKAKGRSSWGKSKAKGTVTFIDDDTMEWTWTEWDSLGLMKILDAKGTSKRK